LTRSAELPQISVIIPYLDRASALRQTLLALAEQTIAPAEFEVIIVDDGSSPGSLEMIPPLALPYAWQIVQQSNQGPGAARNRGTRQAQAAFYVFLDADMIPAPVLLEQYRCTHVAHPETIILGRQLPWPEAFSSSFDQVFNYVAVSDLGPRPVETRFYYLASGNMAIGRQVFVALGGFDEQLRMTEDTDLGYRAWQCGIAIVYQPAAVGYHNHPKTWDQLCAQQRASAQWQARLMRKHPAIYSQIPAYREVEPITLGRDSAYLLLRKAGRWLLATPPFLAVLEKAVRLLRRGTPKPYLLRFFCYRILTSYRLVGLREGFARQNLQLSEAR